ncbi:MAG: hypothetical protein ACRD1G_18680 [Acidimicrobiales bacterium]
MSINNASGDTVDNGYLSSDSGNDGRFPGLKEPANYTYHLRENYYWTSVSCGVYGGSKGAEGNAGMTLFTWPTNKGAFKIMTDVHQHENPTVG